MTAPVKALVVDDDGIMRAILKRVFNDAEILVDDFASAQSCSSAVTSMPRP